MVPEANGHALGEVVKRKCSELESEEETPSIRRKLGRTNKCAEQNCSTLDVLTKKVDAMSEESSEMSSSEDEDSQGEPQFFDLRYNETICNQESTEQDEDLCCCERIRETLLRSRVTLPLSTIGREHTSLELDTGKRLPNYTCPFKGCCFHTQDRQLFMHHIGGGVRDCTHHAELLAICGNNSRHSFLDLVMEASAQAERRRWPQLGLSITRRSLHALCKRFNDAETKCLCCFVCAQLRTTCAGYEQIDLDEEADLPESILKEIYYMSVQDLTDLELENKGVLLNHCSYNLWRQRYALTKEQSLPGTHPWTLTGILESKLSACAGCEERHVSRWAVNMPLFDGHCTLFGCTEDITCDDSTKHNVEEDYETAPYMRTLCECCRVPICSDCLKGMRWSSRTTKHRTSQIPMSLSNDHYYGHVSRFIVEHKVTWLECAASCAIWSTMLVYYLEDPWGHLMDEKLGRPQGRTKVRGNLFSFSMPWDDIEKCCNQAIQAENKPTSEDVRNVENQLGVPHSEETLALLVNVHIVGGSKDLALHLKGLTMRVGVIQNLIEILRCTGYPGYDERGANEASKVANRLHERYTSKYGTAVFTPRAVLEAIKQKDSDKTSLIQDKVATPSEGPQTIVEWDSSLRPHHLMAERSSKTQANIHNHYKSIFAQFGEIGISTGMKMENQHEPWYLGMAFPYTIPSAVGGYDLTQAGEEKLWRRPSSDAFPWPRAQSSFWLKNSKLPHDQLTPHRLVFPPCKVQLFDITRGLPQRIEGQYRRHWGFAPAAWNLLFRSNVNQGASLSVKRKQLDDASNPHMETDAAMAAANLLQKLEKGFYVTPQGKRRRIDGDFSKLLFAEGLSKLQRKLLADFRFRCRSIPGTQEIRTKIGHMGFWASVVYGNGIFMTISPSERHNYLAVRFCRYRQDEPYLNGDRTWSGADAPSLEPNEDDTFHIHIPGYDLRRLLLAEDPLAAVNAFFVQIRTVLATILGIRMCPHCPDCRKTANPCQDTFGSVAELMGGIAGRVDAMFGAVECQKTTGSLHYHFFTFVQRLHQFANMKEIARDLQEGLVHASDLKNFLSNICCESYNDPSQFEEERSYIESAFPAFSEKTEALAEQRWGEVQLGRIPAFIYEDSKGDDDSPIMFKERFNRAFQFFQSRCQHHIHREVNGKRPVPNACRSKTKPKECKHEAPWTNRMSPEWMRGPLLMCKGLAKQFQLRCSGVRNWLGQMLLLRNNEWVNGTIPGLCVALAGSNSDVKPNDRLPILECTHEESCRKKKCIVKKNHLKATSINIQRTQSLTSGYFGGYIGKRQPAGALETKKCVDKLFTLRSQYQGRGKAGQLRAASGRLITDMEMNSTYRGAVEIFNLCRNLKKHDVLAAECIRTFGTVTLDGGQWMHHLERNTYIPPTRKPSIRSNKSRADDREIYGYRPLLKPWKLLSVYEFFRFWRAEPVMLPTYYENRRMASRSIWTEAGELLVNSQEYKEGNKVAKPGIHFLVQEPTDGSYFTLPDEPAVLHHSWVLVRQERPVVVMIENLRMPSAARSTTYNAQYCSLFFRPWTMRENMDATKLVPSLRELGLPVCKRSEQHSSLKTTGPKNANSHRELPSIEQSSHLASLDWNSSWDEYVRGNIVSKYARKLIQSFLLKTVAATGHTCDDDESEAENAYDDPDIMPLRLPPSALEKFLNPLLIENTQDRDEQQRDDLLKETSSKNVLRKTLQRKLKDADYHRSMLLGMNLWQTPKSDFSANTRSQPGHMFAESFEDHIAALKAKDHQVLRSDAPFEEKRHTAAFWFEGNKAKTLDDAFEMILQDEEGPNQEQKAFLVHFIKRLKIEVLEMQRNTVNTSEHEPLLDLIHGFPGTGKSRLIMWMRQLLEKGLGWEHGVHYVCLAFQNAMAASINGYTVHHWSGIPTRSDDGKSTGDRHKQSIKCQALRVIIIDEISMLSAELLGALMHVVTGAVRARDSYKKRKNGDTRCFGGVNVVMLGDFWQLHPVSGVFLASNPTNVSPGRAQNALKLFWGEGLDVVRNYWALTEVMRCKDPWYNNFLQQCRSGSLSKDSYAYFHGFPTFKSPGATCTCNKTVTEDPVLGSVRQDWKEAFLAGCNDMMSLIKSSEEQCKTCTEERKRRKRVIGDCDVNELPEEVRKKPFSDAPALYSFNVPRYFTMQLRAREFAKENNVQLCWCYARDVPLHPGDRDLPLEALQAKLTKWLSRHDQETSHLTSILPLAVGMPIRLTENVDRERQMYRGRRGIIYGWTLATDCVPEEIDGGEFLLPKLPLLIYVKMTEATWKIGDLPMGVYPLRPKSRTWKVHKYTGIEAKRTSFWIIPDFCSTAHMIQGATLKAAYMDAQHSGCNVGLVNQIAAYVCLSRVKQLEGIYVLQSFSPLLFNRGPPEGPERLLRKLENPAQTEDILAEWYTDEALQDSKSGRPLAITHICTCCYLKGNKYYMRSAADFGVTSNAAFHEKYVIQGSWTRCLECQTDMTLPEVQKKNTLTEERLADSFCKQCNIHDKWVGTLKLNSHGCSACQKIFDNREWPKEMLRNHLRFSRKLICSACRANGFTTHCTDGRACKICEKKRGAGKFNKYARWDQSRRNSDIICDDCIDKKRCDGPKCAAILNKSAVSAREWKYKQEEPDSYLLCSNCRAKGLSKKDNKLYQCSNCKEMLGCKYFEVQQLSDKKRGHQTKVECKTCTEGIATRLKHLEAALKKSKRRCTCYQLLHRAKCPLSPCYFGERRWAGSDGYITLEDSQFLNSRTPQPKWWKKANGRQ